jgi:hypothetical protein
MASAQVEARRVPEGIAGYFQSSFPVRWEGYLMRYIWDATRNCMVEKDTGKPMKRSNKAPSGAFFIASELEGYVSPLTSKWVSNKYERTEEMKRENVREVDPSEKDTIANMNNDNFEVKI